MHLREEDLSSRVVFDTREQLAQYPERRRHHASRHAAVNSLGQHLHAHGCDERAP